MYDTDGFTTCRKTSAINDSSDHYENNQNLSLDYVSLPTSHAKLATSRGLQ